MYRVELKEYTGSEHFTTGICVPNVPCGVESRLSGDGPDAHLGFLMYRVELKERTFSPF